MIPVYVKLEAHQVPEGTREIVFTAPAEMPECLPLPTLVTPDGRVLMQWQPTPGELELLTRGVAISIVLYSGGRVAPLSVGVGGMDLR